MKLATIVLLFVLKIPYSFCAVTLECALGRGDCEKCSVDGVWTLWTVWGGCEGECGGVGYELRTRNCSNPPPDRNGALCAGDQRQVKPCRTPACTLEKYEQLLAQDRVRRQELQALRDAATSQPALVVRCLSAHCSLADVESVLLDQSTATKFWNALQCVKVNTGCPVSGGWGPWSEWTRCSAQCGSGRRVRCRGCCDPPPSSPRLSCPGEPCEYQDCNGTNCVRGGKHEGVWSQWSEWSTCNSPCNLGISRRSRICQQARQNSKRKIPSYHSDLDVNDDIYDDDYYNYDLYAGEPKNAVYDYNSAELAEEYDESWENDNSKSKPIRNEQLDNNNYSEEFNENVHDEDYAKETDTTFNIIIRFSDAESVTDDNVDTTPQLPSDTNLENTLNPSTVHDTCKTVSTCMGQLNDDSNSKSSNSTDDLSSKKRTSLINKIKSYSTRSTLVKSISSTITDYNGTPVEEQYVDDETTTKCISTTKKCSTTTESHSPCMKTCTKLRSCGSSAVSKKHKQNENGFNEHISKCTKVLGRKTSTKEIDSVRPESEIGILTEPNSLLTDNEESEHTEKKTTKTGETKKSENCFYTRDKECPKWVYTTTTEEVECNTVKPESEIDDITEEDMPSTIRNELLYETDEYSKSNVMSTNTNTKTSKPTVSTKRTTRNAVEMSTTAAKLSTKRTTGHSVELSTKMSKLSTNQSIENMEVISTTDQTLSSISHSDDIEGGTIGPSNVTRDSNSPADCDLKAVFQLPSQNASFESTDCEGAFEEIEPCNIQPCNADGGWSRWSAWTACSADCGFGQQVSTRSCTNPEPPAEAASCVGNSLWKRSCFLQPCAVKVLTSRAMLMNADSMVRYSALGQQWALLMLYVRLRPVSSSGLVVTRRSAADLVQLSLYDGYVLLRVRETGCHAEMISNRQIDIGDWHEILLTIVGSTVTLRLDDSVLPLVTQLSCRPSSPSYDSAMTIGGQYIGEVDRLAVNLHNFALQKKLSKRDARTISEESIEPEDSHQVQHQVTTEEILTASLAMLLQAPCFVNESEWKAGDKRERGEFGCEVASEAVTLPHPLPSNHFLTSTELAAVATALRPLTGQVNLAVQPQFTNGLVLFLRGRDNYEWLTVTLEHDRVRLRLRLASGLGGCEQPVEIAPLTWLHLSVNKPDGGPVGLAVNGGPRCVASFDSAANTTVDLAIKCTDSMYMGEMPSWVKSLLLKDGTQSPPVRSPLGHLGSLSVDNHTLDLSRLPRRMPPDLIQSHPSSSYWYSSLTASTSAFYEEILVQVAEPFSLTCMYDLSAGGKVSQDNMYKRDRDTAEYSASWMKVDLPVELAFDNNGSDVQYQIWDNGKTTTLNISGFSLSDGVEGFYSCWLHYPLPLQPGLNIITYGVIVVRTDQDIHDFLGSMVFHNLVVIIVLLALLISWLIAEIVLDLYRKSGFYRCGLLNDEDVRLRVHEMIFSQKGEEMLGGTEAANRSYQRFLDYLEQREKDRELEERETTAGETTDDETILINNSEKRDKRKLTTMQSSKENPPRRKESEYHTPNASFDRSPDKIVPNEQNSSRRKESQYFIPSASIDRSPELPLKPSKGVAGLRAGADSPSGYSWVKRNVRDISSEENILRSDCEKPNAQVDTAGDMKPIVEDSLEILSENWRNKQFKKCKKDINTQSNIGVIQKTSAYRHIKNELKFLPEKFLELEKNQCFKSDK